MTEFTVKVIDIRVVMNDLMEYYRGQPEQQFRLFHMTEPELRQLYLHTAYITKGNGSGKPMKLIEIDGVKVEYEGIDSEDELKAYVERGKEKYRTNLVGMTAIADGEYVNLSYDLKNPIPFHRLRRITGYLVGDLSRFNDGKRAEERDRVKHM